MIYEQNFSHNKFRLCLADIHEEKCEADLTK